MKSATQMLQQCSGLIGTPDLTVWEDGFLKGLTERLAKNPDTTTLTARQLEVIERIYNQHFA